MAYIYAAIGLLLLFTAWRVYAQLPHRHGFNGNLMDPKNWEIGPFNPNRVSVGVPVNPVRASDGWSFDIPQAPGHAHYVTAAYGPLTGKHLLRLRYRIDMATGTHIWPLTALGSPSMITLYFQRRGDDWSAAGEYETYRWYAGFAMQMPLEAGEHEMVAPLDGDWGATQTSTRASAPAAIQAAVDQASEVGFVLGGGSGLGHGVYADGPARLTVLAFAVE